MRRPTLFRFNLIVRWICAAPFMAMLSLALPVLYAVFMLCAATSQVIANLTGGEPYAIHLSFGKPLTPGPLKAGAAAKEPERQYA